MLFFLSLQVAIYLERISDPEERKIRRLIFDCLLKRETCISGCSTMSEIDLLELGSYTELQGGNIVLPSGYSSILGPVSRNIPRELILLDHAVKTINWMNNLSENSPLDSGISDPGNDSDDSDKTVTDVPSVCRKKSKDSSSESNNKYCDSDNKISDDSDNSNSSAFSSCTSSSLPSLKTSVEVICENGAKFYADHVICTIPLGVLKEKASCLFSPPLPEYKLESIEKLLFGTVDKIFLAYDRPFLNPDVTEVMLLWNCDTDSSVKGKVASINFFI